MTSMSCSMAAGAREMGMGRNCRHGGRWGAAPSCARACTRPGAVMGKRGTDNLLWVFDCLLEWRHLHTEVGCRRFGTMQLGPPKEPGTGNPLPAYLVGLQVGARLDFDALDGSFGRHGCITTAASWHTRPAHTSCATVACCRARCAGGGAGTSQAAVAGYVLCV